MNARKSGVEPPPGQALPAQAALVDSLTDAAWLVDANSLNLVHANAAAGAWLGEPAEQLAGRRADTLLPAIEDMAFWNDVRAGGAATLSSETELPLPGGRVAHVLRRVVPVRPPQAGESPCLYLVTLHDLSRERGAEREREVLLAELRATLEATADGILVTDLTGRIRAFNRRFAALWSLPESALTERNDQRVYDWMRLNVAQPMAYQQRLDTIVQQMLLSATDTVKLVDGTVLERLTQPQWSHGRPIGRVYSFRELNRRRPGAPRRERADSVDDWTQLPVRSGFVSRLEAAVTAARHGGSAFSVLCIEYDREALFGCGRDDASHARTMVELTEGLRAGLRTPHMVARLGGARFGVLLDGAGEAAAEAMARRLLDQARIVTPGGLATDGLAAVVGVASYPQAGICADDLINNAELVMAQARREGVGYRAHRYTAPADTRRQHRLERALREGLSDPSFRIQYLPRADARTGQIQAVEALVRWHDDQGELLPGQFMPMAERSGMAGKLDDWVMEQALGHAAAWHAAELPLHLTLNVSGWQLTQPNYARRVEAVLRHTGFPAASLELDVTETALATDPEAALQAIKALRRLGVGVVLDDFGAGLASLALLRRYPFTGVKIDRSLIVGLPRNRADAALVAGLVQMARALDIDVVAEGVETEAQRRFVAELGCSGWQGKLCAGPMDPRHVQHWVRHGRAAALIERRAANQP
jgi:diguanylate cyclase (GGDEF)-like protein